MTRDEIEKVLEWLRSGGFQIVEVDRTSSGLNILIRTPQVR